MNRTCRINVLTYFFITYTVVILGGLISSCGKTEEASPRGLNVQLLVANLSPDAYPVDLYLENIRQSTYSYNATPAYFFLGVTNQPLQIRSTRPGGFVLTDTVTLKSNTRYSLFLTGLYADNSIRTILTADDTTALAPAGKGGKVRFINASPRAPGFDVYANGTLAFKSAVYASVSPYVTLPAGNYNFRVFTAGTSATSLIDLNNITIQDGRLYTLYSRGLIGRTDTAALSMAVIANK